MLVTTLMVVILIIILAVTVRQRQNAMLNRPQHQRQAFQAQSLPEQINFHYAEAHRLELLLQQQQSLQYSNLQPVYVPYPGAPRLY